jgi:hypothetical protein
LEKLRNENLGLKMELLRQLEEAREKVNEVMKMTNLDKKVAEYKI